jgi:hypothetical protein
VCLPQASCDHSRASLHCTRSAAIWVNLELFWGLLDTGAFCLDADIAIVTVSSPYDVVAESRRRERCG